MLNALNIESKNELNFRIFNEKYHGDLDFDLERGVVANFKINFKFGQNLKCYDMYPRSKLIWPLKNSVLAYLLI